MVDEVINIECGELGEYFQFLSRVAKSIVGQGSRGVRAGLVGLGEGAWFV